MIIAAAIMRPCKILPAPPLLVLALSLSLAAPGLRASEHAPPPVTAATTFPDVEVHEDEKVAIAADPYDTRDKEKLLRVKYSDYSILPVRVIITNNGDKPISLEQARINFITAEGAKILAAEPEDVERRTSRSDNAGKKIPLPAPLPSIHTAPGKMDKQIEEDFHDFEFQALIVEGHTTRAGFLFYDISGLRQPLRGAKLYLRKLQSADGKDLFYFEVPFDKYLAAQPK